MSATRWLDAYLEAMRGAGPNSTERCVVCDEQYCDTYRDGQPDEPAHDDCLEGA